MKKLLILLTILIASNVQAANNPTIKIIDEYEIFILGFHSIPEMKTKYKITGAISYHEIFGSIVSETIEELTESHMMIDLTQMNQFDDILRIMQDNDCFNGSCKVYILGTVKTSVYYVYSIFPDLIGFKIDGKITWFK